MAVLRDLRGCASLTTGQNRRKEATCWQLKKESFDMARYLTSFDDGSMDHIPEAELPAVDEAAHNVVREAKAAGVWIFGGGVLRQQATIVAANGAFSQGPLPETKAVLGGFSIIEVPTRDEALA
jgi:hypothetical protein